MIGAVGHVDRLEQLGRLGSALEGAGLALASLLVKHEADDEA